MIAHKGTKMLTTKRLILRRFTTDDAQDMFCNWANDPRVTKYVQWLPHGCVENTQKLLKIWTDGYSNNDCYNWAIECDGHAIGSIGTVGFDNKNESATIGYCMGANWRNHGLMTEALKAVINYFFEEIGVHRISACHDILNIGSGRVMQKSGMQYEGIKRECVKNNTGNRYCSLANYAILCTDARKC